MDKKLLVTLGVAGVAAVIIYRERERLRPLLDRGMARLIALVPVPYGSGEDDLFLEEDPGDLEEALATAVKEGRMTEETVRGIREFLANSTTGEVRERPERRYADDQGGDSHG